MDPLLPSDENVQTLLAMGFPSESEIKRALKMAKNDMNEAVDILTNGQVMSTYDDLSAPSPQAAEHAESGSMDTSETEDFPAANLYELESRVFTDSWSIPYREDESLAKCMFSSIKLLDEGRAAHDTLCSRFLDRCLPDAFRKLLNSQAIYKWSADIQEGVYDMILILMELVASSLTLPSKGEQTYIPHILLETLALSFSPNCEYHQKNKLMRAKVERWDELLGADNVICYPIKSSIGSKEYSWLANLVNKFHYHQGIEMITDIITFPKTNLSAMASLIEPLANCVAFLAPKIAKPLFEKSIKKIMHTIEHLGPDDFREKNIGKACDLLRNVKVIYQHLWSDNVSDADDKQLDLVYRMIRCPHFNAKMNALIEITKMIEDATNTRSNTKGSIPLSTLTRWMTTKELLSVILSGSIDQAQYCDKVKRIVEHVGPHLSREDLEKLWNRRCDQTGHVIDNIHSIFAAAASQFTIDKFAAFTQLITSNWSEEKESMQEKLISLLGQIGKDTKNFELAQKVLEVMWELSHRSDLSRDLVDKCLDEMYHVMVDSTSIKDSYKKKYLEKCVDCIRKGQWIIPALRQLLSVVKHIVRQATTRADKSRVMIDINKSSDVIKLLVSSLVTCHQNAVRYCTDKKIALGTAVLVDDRYSHKEFVLQEGSNSMSWNRVKEFWECLIGNPGACDWDKDQGYAWLREHIEELETDAVCNLFTKKIMTDQSSQLSSEGFKCWKKFFDHINLHQHNLRKATGYYTVEKLELTGLEELWNLCLNLRDMDIAQQAISFLLQNLYKNLATKYKKDVVSLHKRFIKECHERLEALLISLRGGGSAVYKTLSLALYQLVAVSVPGLDQLPPPMRPKYVLNIERLLLIVEQYVLTVEEVYHSPRSILPHGSSFYGYPLTIHCECETNREQFITQTHRNESLLSFKALIGDRLKISTEEILFNQSELKSDKDQRLLGQLGLVNGSKVSFRLGHASGITSSIGPSLAPQASSSSASALPALSENIASSAGLSASAALGAASPSKPGNWEMEKNLPGVIIAQDGQVFRLLYQLADLNDQRITQRIVALLHLIPTDPSVIDLVDNIGATGEIESLPSSSVSTPCASPSPSPRKVRLASGPHYGSQTSMLSRKSSNSIQKLNSLFNVSKSNPELSPFRVRYNLEVLSSRIMPVDMPNSHPTQFCEDFLANNGLANIMQVFQVDYFPADVEYEIRQACYSLALQLIAYLLCGETVRGTTLPYEVMCSQSISNMEGSELTELMSCMVRVAWAASIGKLHLCTSMQPTRDANVYGRFRENSVDSSTSSNSESEATCLHAGVCLSQTNVDDVDCSIAVKAFQILIFCLNARPEIISGFYTLPCVTDFLLDVLTGCCHDVIRTSAADTLKQLSNITSVPNHVEKPKHFLLKVVLDARLPYWVSHTSTRGTKQRLLEQCLQFFDLRCHLLHDLLLTEQTQLSINIDSMLKDELAWLCNFHPSNNRKSDLSTDDVLLTGHLRLVCALFTCQGVDSDNYIPIVHTLLDDFLFPAAKLQLSIGSLDSLADFSPKCMVPLSQSAAYDVLVEICQRSPLALKTVTAKLIDWHHNAVETTEWEYMPPVEGRATSGFVGLKNGGATCYMNSVIQQMFMTPGIAEFLLGVDDSSDEIDMGNVVFREIQQVFGHLQDSQLQYYEPRDLWHVFKLWGQSVNIREQQDAFDFFTALTDQLDESLKKLEREPVFQNRLQGVYSDQKNCQDCPHKYEREEPFLALNLTVSSPSLEQSLDQFVRGELLEGDNAYFCEKCNQKRSAIKQMRIKSLPPVLCIHLKRFSFDWEANKALKFDDYFKFPMELDMGPYTIDGKSVIYELVGVVVHTGQASAGHYYSFIKDRRGSSKSNNTHGKWFKFNDTTVEEFVLTEETLATECFGGRYKAKNTDIGMTKLPEDRVRYWNAYLLFYERKIGHRLYGNRRSSRLQVMRKSQSSSSTRHDSLSELSDLIHQGEKQGMFASKMPGCVQRSVRDENLQFLRNKNVYSDQYFKFLYNLALIESDDDEVVMIVTETALKFILNTYLRTKETLRGDMTIWFSWYRQVTNRCPQSVAWFIDYITSDPHTYIVPYLISCGIKDVREFFCDILSISADTYITCFQTFQQPIKRIDILIETLLALLDREVVEYSKQAYEFFQFFYNYSCLDTMPNFTCKHLMAQDVLPQFLRFLIGKSPEVMSTDGIAPRRFTLTQSREFGPLHCTIAMLILHLDLHPKVDLSCFPVLERRPNPDIDVEKSHDVTHVFADHYCYYYIREALIAIKEIDASSVAVITDALVYLSHTLPDYFSNKLIAEILHQLSITAGNELKGITKLATQLCLLPDSLQETRLKALISDPNEGILKLIRENQLTDSQKSYQLIKLLTSASDKSECVAQFLICLSKQWQWCVDWLKKKMGEESWTSHTTLSNEDSLSRNFQRTMSAQDTLNKATAMFTTSQGSSSDMDVDSIASEDLQTVPNLD